jgi:hypothetical protein
MTLIRELHILKKLFQALRMLLKNFILVFTLTCPLLNVQVTEGPKWRDSFSLD